MSRSAQQEIPARTSNVDAAENGGGGGSQNAVKQEVLLMFWDDGAQQYDALRVFLCQTLQLPRSPVCSLQELREAGQRACVKAQPKRHAPLSGGSQRSQKPRG